MQNNGRARFWRRQKKSWERMMNYDDGISLSFLSSNGSGYFDQSTSAAYRNVGFT